MERPETADPDEIAAGAGGDGRPAPPPEETLPVAVLLSVAGGFLDAFTWLAHGGVFANAQTGNVVLLGLFAASGQWAQAFRHVPPIVAFILGVFAAQGLRARGGRRDNAQAALLSLGVEIGLLAVVAALPRDFPDLPIVLGVAFVAALQSSSFARVEGAGYSSVMTTGNLRRMAEALIGFALGGPAPPNDGATLRQAFVFGTICMTFGLGAAIGASCTSRLANAALAIPTMLLLAALVLCIVQGHAHRSSSRAR